MFERLSEEARQRLRRLTLELAGDRAPALEALAHRSNGEYGVDPFGFILDYALSAVAPVRLALPELLPGGDATASSRCPRAGCCWSRTTPGQLPMDGAMIGVAMLARGDPPRAIRSMVEKWVPSLPYVSTFLARVGQIVGTPENCRRLLDADEAILVFPEGGRGHHQAVAPALPAAGVRAGLHAAGAGDEDAHRAGRR